MRRLYGQKKGYIRRISRAINQNATPIIEEIYGKADKGKAELKAQPVLYMRSL